MSTAWDQLERAALTLARSGAIKDRLADAYRNHLAYLRSEDLPEVLRADFRACSEALTRERPLGNEDAVRATVRKMSASEADELACSVVRLFAGIVRECSIETAHGALLHGNGMGAKALNGFNGLANGARAKNGASAAAIALAT